MWNTQEIDDLAAVPPASRALEGYPLNIRPALMAEDLKPFVVTPSAPARRWGDDLGVARVPEVNDPSRPGKLDFSKAAGMKPTFSTVFLLFPDEATARSSSLGRFWVDP